MLEEADLAPASRAVIVSKAFLEESCETLSSDAQYYGHANFNKWQISLKKAPFIYHSCTLQEGCKMLDILKLAGLNISLQKKENSASYYLKIMDVHPERVKIGLIKYIVLRALQVYQTRRELTQQALAKQFPTFSWFSKWEDGFIVYTPCPENQLNELKTELKKSNYQTKTYVGSVNKKHYVGVLVDV